MLEAKIDQKLLMAKSENLVFCSQQQQQYDNKGINLQCKEGRALGITSSEEKPLSSLIQVKNEKLFLLDH